LERTILQSGLPLPLNIRDNPSLRHTSYLQELRRSAPVAAPPISLAVAAGRVASGYRLCCRKAMAEPMTGPNSRASWAQSGSEGSLAEIESSR
jgi:hypothetical protein